MEISWGVKSTVSGVAKEATLIFAKTYERTIEDGWSGANKWTSEGSKIFFMKGELLAGNWGEIFHEIRSTYKLLRLAKEFVRVFSYLPEKIKL